MYRYAWNEFVRFCERRTPPQRPLPAPNAIVAMFLQNRTNRRPSGSYAAIRTASAAISQMHRINLFPSPTLSLPCTMVRSAAKRSLGLAVRNNKEPFTWANVCSLINDRCQRSTGFSSWIIATMAAICFAGFCRYSDAANLLWEDVSFHGSYMELRF